MRRGRLLIAYNLRVLTTDCDKVDDMFCTVGGVRSFFKERKAKLGQTNSAGQLHSYQTKKKEGYDKSHPLQPINHNTQNSTRFPSRGKSDPALINSSKVSVDTGYLIL